MEKEKEIKREVEYIERNLSKLNERTWQTYKEQIASHVEEIKLYISSPGEGKEEGKKEIKSAEDFLKEKFVNPQSQDWFRPVCQMMEEYKNQFTSARGEMVMPSDDEIKQEITEAVAYGLGYAAGPLGRNYTRDEIVAIADKWIERKPKRLSSPTQGKEQDRKEGEGR